MKAPIPGSKLGPWAFNTCLLLAVALFAFGLSEDKAAPVRDANIEIGLLTRGPVKDFQEYCRAATQSQLPNHQKIIKENFLNLLSQSDIPHDGTSLSFSGLYICPFPTTTQTLKSAIDLVLNPNLPFQAIYLKEVIITLLSDDLRQLSKETHRPAIVSSPPFTVDKSIMYMANNILNGEKFHFNTVSILAYQSAEEKEPTSIIDCASHMHMFSPLNENTISNIRIRIDNYCLEASWEDRKYLTSTNSIGGNYLRGYFSNRIRTIVGYSRPDAAEENPKMDRLE